MKPTHFLLSLSLLSCLACSDSNDDNLPLEPADITKQITINAASRYQTIDGFGASDCWVPHYIGKYWADNVKEDIARLLFSSSVSSGQPQGIGLSAWRFNLGGGTAEQGSDSGIEDKSRRSECFLQADGSLDWTRQEGQQYFLRKAKEYGCAEFVMFSNTPPVYFTRNGKGYSAMGSRSNLKDDCYGAFAAYMAEVTDYFKKNKGIEFTLISPVNEPQYDWNEPSQEGTAWQNSEIKRLTVELDKALEEKNLNNTRILLAEAGDWEYTYKEKNDAQRSNVIFNFFDSSSANYVGDLKHVFPAIAGHSYWTDGSWNTLNSVRSQVASAASARQLKVYQTEWSMLGDNYNSDGYPGHQKASYLDMALYLSKVLHSDLTVANASSWSYWTSMDSERWDQKCRFHLIKVTPAGGDYGDFGESGTYEATKNLWVLGNYSLFIRPGYQRVSLSIPNTSNSFFGSAYISPEGDRLVAVYTNLTSKSIALDIKLEGLGKKVTGIKRYTTSQTENLIEDELPGDHCAVQPQSVITLVYQLNE